MSIFRTTGLLSRVHHRGERWRMRRLLPLSLLLVSSNSHALAAAAGNTWATHPNFAALTSTWQWLEARLLIELAFVAAAGTALWLLLLQRRREVRARIQARRQSAALLRQEHARRLNAQHESRSLSQRLLTAHEIERSHLARELHDDVTQRLARLAIDAAQLDHGPSASPDAPTPRSIREALVRLSEDVHSLAYRLHPSILEDLGLVEALRAECDRFTRQERVRATLKLRNVPGDIRPEAAFVLFRIAQEALRNVARHAQAHTVEVSLARLEGGLQLAVHDDGIGFDRARARQKPSLGHACMKERISLLKGELDIESTPGQGTDIVAWVPLQQPSQTNESPTRFVGR